MNDYYFSSAMRNLKPSAIREILKMSSDPAVIPFSAGNPAPDAFPVEAVARITAEIMAEQPILALQYSVTEGYDPLRESLRTLAKEHYTAMGAQDELMVVSGAQQGIDLCCRVLCDAGDVILCEDPSFIGSLNSFRSNGVQLVGVPMEKDGISLSHLESTLKTQKNVRFLYLIPNFQNPSGITMSAQKRKAVYALCSQYNVLILEDNPYGDLRFAGTHIPPIKALDSEGRVIYCGSFSKILSPGLRVGFVVAPQAIIQKMTVAKQCADVHTTILSQLIAYRFLKEEDLTAHIEHLRAIYRRKCKLMIDGIKENFDSRITFIEPEGGLFVWCTLPQGADMLAFCKSAVSEHKVALVPGSAFSADPSQVVSTFRMNFSTPTDEAIQEGTRRVGALSKQFLK